MLYDQIFQLSVALVKGEALQRGPYCAHMGETFRGRVQRFTQDMPLAEESWVCHLLLPNGQVFRYEKHQIDDSSFGTATTFLELSRS